MKRKTLIALLFVSLFSTPIIYAEHVDHLHRADTSIMIKDLTGEPVGLIYFYLAANQSIEHDSSTSILGFSVSFQTWRNETHYPPIEQIELKEVYTGYGFYDRDSEPIRNLELKPSNIILRNFETESWFYTQTLDTVDPEMYAYLKIGGGITITTMDGVEYVTPITVEISSLSSYYSSHEIVIFDEAINVDSPFYLGADYHGFVYDFSDSYLMSNLSLRFEELSDYNAEVLIENDVLSGQVDDFSDQVDVLSFSLNHSLVDNLDLMEEIEVKDDLVDKLLVQRRTLIILFVLSILGLLFCAFRKTVKKGRVFRFCTMSSKELMEVVLVGKYVFMFDDFARRLCDNDFFTVVDVVDQGYLEWVKENGLVEANRPVQLSDLLNYRNRR